MAEHIEQLTEELIEQFWNRKRPCRLDVVVDVDTELFYLVPVDIEHKDFIPTLPHERDTAMVPFWMTFEKDGKYNLRELVIGASSFEATKGVKHTQKMLYAGRDLAWQLIQNSPAISNASIQRDDVLTDYCDYTKKN